MTQSCSSANAVSASFRSAALSDECETNVRVFKVRSATANSSTLDLLSQKTSRFEPRFNREMTVAALAREPTWSMVTSASVLTDDDPTTWLCSEPANHLRSSSGFLCSFCPVHANLCRIDICLRAFQKHFLRCLYQLRVQIGITSSLANRRLDRCVGDQE